MSARRRQSAATKLAPPPAPQREHAEAGLARVAADLLALPRRDVGTRADAMSAYRRSAAREPDLAQREARIERETGSLLALVWCLFCVAIVGLWIVMTVLG